MEPKHWNRCDWCGQFIAYEDFLNGAIRELFTPDTEFTAETYKTLCKECSKKERKD